MSIPALEQEDDSSHLNRKNCLQHFIAEIRDRLALYFQMAGNTRRPKLISIAAISPGAGTTTLAYGLATALSESDDKKVLLVDMNFDRADSSHTNKIIPVRPLALVEALKPVDRPGAPAAESLCLARVEQTDTWEGQVVPAKFFDLVPDLKSSRFDYILFDMPPLSQTSAALAMAGLMDKLLLVVEAEMNTREAIARTLRELAASKANVSVIFNKIRTYGPKSLRELV